MKSARTFFHIMVLSTVVALLFAPVLAQDKTQVKVKGSEVVTGVVIVDLVKDGRALELQCNQGAAACAVLKSGTYILLELPKNYGMYDCKNAEIYPSEKNDPQPSDRIGAYCLIEK
jgi:hypothetical protein